MTRKEAIEILKNYNKGFTGYAGNLQEAIDIAINSLEVDEAYQLEYERTTKQQDGRQALLNLLSKEPIEVLQTAFLYAKNYTQYGANVVEQWQTAVQQSANLQRAHQKGYYEAMACINSTPTINLDELKEIKDEINRKINTEWSFKAVMAILDKKISELEKQNG